MIRDLPYMNGQTITGTFRIHRPEHRTARNGHDFISLVLEDLSGTIKAFAWRNRYEGPPFLTEMDKVLLTGTMKQFNGEWHIDVLSIESLRNAADDPLALVPSRLCPEVGCIEQLRELVGGLASGPLSSFIREVLADDTISLPFVTVPASRHHHHAWPGGLLVHSLECAEVLAALPCFTGGVRELGIVAALLHDVGKIRTSVRTRGHPCLGTLVGHDALTLEVLAPHLLSLDKCWPDGGAALRYLLTWRSGNRPRFLPLITIAEAVTTADRISCGLDRDEAAFATAPEWQTLITVDGTKRWRVREAPGTATTPTINSEASNY